MDVMDMDERLEKIRRRQLARFLVHLANKGVLNSDLERDVKRNYRFVFEDVRALIDGELSGRGNEYGDQY